MVATSAWAHDGMHVAAASRGTNALEATVAMRSAHFDYPGYRHGEYVTVMPGLRAQSAFGMWAELAVPVHALHFVGADNAGLGDVHAAVGHALVRAERWSLNVSLGSMWPSGDPHAGLGSAHLMLAPRVDTQIALGRFRAGLAAAVRGAIAWGEHGVHEHQPLVAPHDLLDVAVNARAGVRFFDALELCAHLDPVAVAIPHPVQPVGTRLTAGLAAAFERGDWRADASLDVPVTKNRAYEWQVGAAVTYRFSAPSTGPTSVRR